MKKDVEELVKDNKRFQTLCRNVFSSGQGKELLAKMKEVYCDGQLYDENTHTMAYLIGQRDAIMELTYNVEHGDIQNADG